VRRTNAAVSYFIGLDAQPTLPFAALAGDRMVFRGWNPARSAIVPVTNTQSFNTVHGTNGHFAFADGSVMRVGEPGWPAVSAYPPGYTNRLLMPFPPP
jgi:prepilin-type processing-associated H-X9-DG protein